MINYDVKNLYKHKCKIKLVNTNFIDVDINKMLNKTYDNNNFITDTKKMIKQKNNI